MTIDLGTSSVPRSRIAAHATALVRLGALGCFAVAVWLASVLLVVRPPGIAGQSGLWIIVLAGFMAYGVAGLALIARPSDRMLRWAVLLSAPMGVVLGLVGIGSQVTRAAAGGDFEGYVLLMGAGLAAQAAAMLVFLYATRRPGPTLTARASG